MAAEALASTGGLEDAMFLQKMMEELLGRAPEVIAHVDNKGLVNQLHSSKLVQDRKLRINIGMIKQMMERNEVGAVNWCPTDEQPADVLTKKGASGTRLVGMLTRGQK